MQSSVQCTGLNAAWLVQAMGENALAFVIEAGKDLALREHKGIDETDMEKSVFFDVLGMFMVCHSLANEQSLHVLAFNAGNVYMTPCPLVYCASPVESWKGFCPASEREIAAWSSEILLDYELLMKKSKSTCFAYVLINRLLVICIENNLLTSKYLLLIVIVSPAQTDMIFPSFKGKGCSQNSFWHHVPKAFVQGLDL